MKKLKNNSSVLEKMIAEIHDSTLSKKRITLTESGTLLETELARAFNQLSSALHDEVLLTQEKEDSLRITLQSMADGVIVTDHLGNITLMNPAALEMTAWTIEDAKGLPFHNVFIINNYLTGAPGQEIVKTVLETKKGVLLANHTVLMAKDGTKRHISDSAAPIINYNGEVQGVVIIFSDVTERYALQAQIKEKELMFRSSFEQAAVGMCHISLDGRFILINDRLCEILGYPREELINLTFSSITHPDDQDKSQRGFLEASRNIKGKVSIEKRYLRKDGTIVWVNITAAPVKSEQGIPLYLIAIIEDITARKNAEAAVFSTEERLNRAQEFSHVGNWELNLHTMSIWGSNEALRIYGIDGPNEFNFQEAKSVVYPDDRPRMDQLLSELIHESKPYDTEFRIKKKNTGELRIIHSIGRLEKNEDGKPIGITGVIQDITDKKRMEDEYKLVLQTTLAGFVIINEEGCFLEVNDTYCAMIGYHKNDILSKRIHDFHLLENDMDIKDFISRVMETGSIQFQTQHRRCNGKLIDFHVNAIYSPTREHIYMFLHDITEQKENVRALTQAKIDAEAANIAKSQFLANMSHEIRTPLNGLMGMLQLLDRTELSSEQQELLHYSSVSSRALLGVINDILDQSKLEAGMMKLETISFSLRSLVDDIIGLFQVAAIKSGISIHSSIDASIPETLYGDPFRLKQVLSNLVGNAIKFTEKGYIELMIHPENPEVNDEHSLFFSIKDTGIGIPNHQIPSLFKNFSQVDNSNTRLHGGTGLGLSICKNLVELMGGSIGVESTEGIGSHFYFTCKLKTLGATLQTTAIAVGSGAAKPRLVNILVAEDDEISKMVVERFAKENKWNTTIASDGFEVLELYRKNTYDIVLMDIQMPIKNGYTVSKEIRQMEEITKTHTPIIAMTAFALNGDRQKCLDAGMDDYITKPLLMEPFSEIVLKWVK